MKIIENIDWTPVIAGAESYISWLEEGIELRSKPLTILYTVLEAVYGPDVNDYIYQKRGEYKEARAKQKARDELVAIKKVLEKYPDLKEELLDELA